MPTHYHWVEMPGAEAQCKMPKFKRFHGGLRSWKAATARQQAERREVIVWLEDDAQLECGGR